MISDPMESRIGMIVPSCVFNISANNAKIHIILSQNVLLEHCISFPDKVVFPKVSRPVSIFTGSLLFPIGASSDDLQIDQEYVGISLLRDTSSASWKDQLR